MTARKRIAAITNQVDELWVRIAACAVGHDNDFGDRDELAALGMASLTSLGDLALGDGPDDPYEAEQLRCDLQDVLPQARRCLSDTLSLDDDTLQPLQRIVDELRDRPDDPTPDEVRVAVRGIRWLLGCPLEQDGECSGCGKACADDLCETCAALYEADDAP